MKERPSRDLSWIKAGYAPEKWKWTLRLLQDKNVPDVSELISKISEEDLLHVYGLDRIPKILPCNKKCTKGSPWCLADVGGPLESSRKKRPIHSPREEGYPVGLQNTANTCWINSAVQALFHQPHFRNAINCAGDFEGEKSLENSIAHLLQATFIEMEKHKNKALACAHGTVFEKLAVFVTQDIMRKDQDFEVLKCVSEFLENVIDRLLGDPSFGLKFSPLFSITLTRVARWKCSNCEAEHIDQMPSDTCYTLAAYISAEECPLDQIILDLQTETQTGVTLLCSGEPGGKPGCGSVVKVDRVVTPCIYQLPKLLIIRNNSLLDRDNKRRLHVVYPEVLDLTSYTINGTAAKYKLRAVIFHHGHWVKHFSAHVRTWPDDKWYNFNDEYVIELGKRGSRNAQPSETNKNYFSHTKVAEKYANCPNLRVSKGAFIWLYEMDTGELSVADPPDLVVEYVSELTHKLESKDTELLRKIQKQREALFKNLSLKNSSGNYVLIPRPLLQSWLASEDITYNPQMSLLEYSLCVHKKLKPPWGNHYLIKCIEEEKTQELLNEPHGIQCSYVPVPVVMKREDALCVQCVAMHCHNILFREKLKLLHKESKKEATCERKDGYEFIGQVSLAMWPRIALEAYLKESGLDEELSVGLEDQKNDITEDKCVIDEETSGTGDTLANSMSGSLEAEMSNGKVKAEEDEFAMGEVSHQEPQHPAESNDSNVEKGKASCDAEAEAESFCLNEDIVCPHKLRSSEAPLVWVPLSTFQTIKDLCRENIHPAACQIDFTTCPDCEVKFNTAKETCCRGSQEKKQLTHLFNDRKRPSAKFPSSQVFLLSKEFLSQWKSYLRACEKQNLNALPPKEINNASLLCGHNCLLYAARDVSEATVMVWEEEWQHLKDVYSSNAEIKAVFNTDGSFSLIPEPCRKGCIERRLAAAYEDQFTYKEQLIYLRQVNSENDIPCRSSLGTIQQPLILKGLRKKPRLETTDGENSLSGGMQRLIRASRNFSSTDTMKAVQNYIAECTGIWPLLQNIWIIDEKGNPVLLSEEAKAQTLGSLRIKPGDTVYFRANKEDMEKAAGDGVIEYEEIEDF